MRITDLQIETIQIPMQQPLKIAFTVVEKLDNVLVKVTTDNGLVGYGEAAPFPLVTGETAEGVISVLKVFRQGLIGMDPWDIEAIHAMMDSVIIGNGSAKCAVDLAMYDLMGKAAGLPVYKLLGGYDNKVQSDITIGISSPEAMAAEAKHYVQDLGYHILKIKAGIDYQQDIRTMKLIRQAVGPDIRLRVDANQGYNASVAVSALEGFKTCGIEAVEQCLPYWNIEDSALVRSKVNGIQIMLDESIHGPLDAARVCRQGAADVLNIKLMKCGGLYPALKINTIAESFGVNCMVGCMLETKLSIGAGMSLVAAQRNVTEADCDSFLFYQENPIEGCFSQNGDIFTLSDEPGFGAVLNF